MKIGLISDVHGNALALEASLARCDLLGVDQLVFLGDLVGYGAEPEQVVQRVAALVIRGAVAVLGNHDEAISKRNPDMNETALRAIVWTRSQLSEASRNFILSLPLTAEVEGCLMVHADACQPGRWNYVTGTDSARRFLAATHAPISFCGHVHVPQLYCTSVSGKTVGHTPESSMAIPLFLQRKWLAVVGSVGQPRDGKSSASFAVFDTVSREIIFLRAPYDVEKASENVRAAGLPGVLAERLIRGA